MSNNTRRAGVLGGVKVRGVTIRPTTDYTEIENKPKINGVTLEGDKSLEDLGITGGGTANYEALQNKPSIAGVTLEGDKSLEDLGITDTTDYEEMSNHPMINGVELVGDKTSEELGIHGGGTDYTFAEGDVDGAFVVVPVGGEAQVVKVHGLRAFCLGNDDDKDEEIILHTDSAEEMIAEAGADDGDDFDGDGPVDDDI